VAFGDPVYGEPVANANQAPEGSKIDYYAERGFDLRRLPYTRTEVTGIGALFPGSERRVFLGTDANEQKVKSETLDRYRYIHFAAHGVVDEENPARSGIVLSLEGSEKEDGVLQVTEIMRLKLNADLVTLSACRTGLGKVVSGEGVLGLTRAFFYAGARGVVVSLWSVNDTATAEMMKIFYRNLKRGMSKDESLRQAKLELSRGKHLAWRHPYYWAGFVLVGE
jgi:CHAT domain-containing protein